MADLYRAMATFPQHDEPIALGGLRHVREWAENDLRGCPAGYTERWIEEATWTRVDEHPSRPGTGDAVHA